MPEFSSGYSGGGIVRAHGATSGTSSVSTTITAGSIHSKGSWVELVASTAFDANWIEIEITQFSASILAGVLDIGIGAATEQVLISNLFVAEGIAGQSAPTYLFPVFIPAGSRICARFQESVFGSRSVNVSIRLISGNGITGGSGPSVVTYGYGGVSLGTNIDPGSTANTDSSAVQITASTERDHHWLVVAGRFGDGNLGGSVSWRLNVLTGASTEASLIADIHLSGPNGTSGGINYVRHYPIFIPKSTRLSAIVRSSSNADSDRDAWIMMYGAG